MTSPTPIPTGQPGDVGPPEHGSEGRTGIPGWRIALVVLIVVGLIVAGLLLFEPGREGAADAAAGAVGAMIAFSGARGWDGAGREAA